MADGWLIGVMVELRGESAPLRRLFAVGHGDQAKAEWRAVGWRWSWRWTTLEA